MVKRFLDLSEQGIELMLTFPREPSTAVERVLKFGINFVRTNHSPCISIFLLFHFAAGFELNFNGYGLCTAPDCVDHWEDL